MLTVVALPAIGLLLLSVLPRTASRITQSSMQTLAYGSLGEAFGVYSALSLAGIGSHRLRLAAAILSGGALLLRHAVQLGAMSAKRRKRSAKLVALSGKAQVPNLPGPQRALRWRKSSAQNPSWRRPTKSSPRPQAMNRRSSTRPARATGVNDAKLTTLVARAEIGFREPLVGAGSEKSVRGLDRWSDEAWSRRMMTCLRFSQMRVFT